MSMQEPMKKEIVAELVKTEKFKAARNARELSVDELGAVTGGVGAWMFEHEGTVWGVVCSKRETTNALVEECLVLSQACAYASPGATTCFECQYIYFGDMGIVVD